MVLNLRMVKGFPCLPARTWRKKTGNPVPVRMINEMMRNTGDKRMIANSAKKRSKIYLMKARDCISAMI